MQPNDLSVLLTLLQIASSARAQGYPNTDRARPDYGAYTDTLSTNKSSDTLLCNSSIASANASGIYTFGPAWPVQNHSNEEIPDPAWAITIAARNNSIQASLWYDTAGQNYSDDLGIGYDVCAFPIFNLPDNANRLGQTDSGNCSETLSASCRDALQTGAEDSALMWTTYATPPPYSNLSAGVLPYICNRIQLEILAEGWPKECKQQLDAPRWSFGAASMDRAPLTGYNESILSTPCHITSPDESRNFSRVDTAVIANSEGNYNNATRGVVPILTVFFPVANSERVSYFGLARSNITCVRPRDFSEGSRVSPELPPGEPYRDSTVLSKGTIAGIVIGAVFGVLLVCVTTWLFFKRRTRKRRQPQESGEGSEKVPELDGVMFTELHGEDKKPEMDNGDVPELPSGQGSRRSWRRRLCRGSKTLFLKFLKT